MSSNWYIENFNNQIGRKSLKIPRNRLKKCKIWIEIFEDDIKLINELLEKLWGYQVNIVCALSLQGIFNKLIGITEEYININQIQRLRNDFGYRFIFLDISTFVEGTSDRFIDKIQPSNWFLKKCQFKR